MPSHRYLLISPKLLKTLIAILIGASIIAAHLIKDSVDSKSANEIVLLPAGESEAWEDDGADALTHSAISGKNRLAGNLEKPRLPKDMKGIVNPDEEKKDKSYKYDPSLIPPPFDQTGMRIKPTRLRKIHEAGDSGWGYVNPVGFTEDPKAEGLWRSKDAIIRVTNAHTGDECRPICAGEVLTLGQLKRSTASGRRTHTFLCDENISLGGETWPLYETTILAIRPSACVKTTLAARSAAARKQVQGDYFNMRRRLAPLPPLPEKPLFDKSGRSLKARTLR
ncbi:MAG: hypothetical protein ABII00_18600 [Elusimicrobiota bacterium]